MDFEGLSFECSPSLNNIDPSIPTLVTLSGIQNTFVVTTNKVLKIVGNAEIDGLILRGTGDVYLQGLFIYSLVCEVRGRLYLNGCTFHRKFVSRGEVKACNCTFNNDTTLARGSVVASSFENLVCEGDVEITSCMIKSNECLLGDARVSLSSISTGTLTGGRLSHCVISSNNITCEALQDCSVEGCDKGAYLTSERIYILPSSKVGVVDVVHLPTERTEGDTIILYNESNSSILMAKYGEKIVTRVPSKSVRECFFTGKEWVCK